MVEEESLSVLAAFAIDLFATFLTQFSYLMMKWAHVDVEKKNTSPYCTLKWLTGFIILFVGSILHIVVLPFCPMVLLATNSATAIIISAILAVYFLGERIVWRFDITAFVLIAAGTTSICMISSESEKQLTTDMIVEQLESVSTITFGLSYICFFVFNYVFMRWFGGQISLFYRQASKWADLQTSATDSSKSTIVGFSALQNDSQGQLLNDSSLENNFYVRLSDENRQNQSSNLQENSIGAADVSPDQQQLPKQRKILPNSTLIVTIQNTNPEQLQEIAPGMSRNLKRFIKYPMVSLLLIAGAQCGITATFAKYFTELITQAKFESREISLMVIVWVISASSSILQIRYLNCAIAQYQQIECIAVYQVTIIIWTVICAFALLDEAAGYSTTQLLAILGGIALCIGGIQVITTCKASYLASSDKAVGISTTTGEDDAGSTSSEGNETQLLHDEKTSDHTKHLVRLFRNRPLDNDPDKDQT